MTQTLFSLTSETVPDEDTLRKQLVRLIELCEAAGIDLHRLFNEAWFEYSSETDVKESG